MRKAFGSVVLLGLVAVGCQHGDKNAAATEPQGANMDVGEAQRTTGLPTYDYPTANAADASGTAGGQAYQEPFTDKNADSGEAALDHERAQAAAQRAEAQRQAQAQAAAGGSAAGAPSAGGAAAAGAATGAAVGAAAASDREREQAAEKQAAEQQKAEQKAATSDVAKRGTELPACDKPVAVTSSGAVGDPCLTTSAFVKLLPLSAQQKQRADREVARAEEQVAKGAAH